MRLDQHLVIAVFLFVGAFALAQKNPDDLKQRIHAQAKSLNADDYAFTRTIRSEENSGAKKEVKVEVEKFDPSKSADARWTLVSVNDAPPSANDLKQFQKDSAKYHVPGYYRLADYFGSPATTTTDAHGRTTFRFTALPKATVIVFDSDVSQNAAVEASVNEGGGTPFVEQMHSTVGSMRIKLLFKLQSYEATARYQLGPEGKPLLVERVSDIVGSGMGKQGKFHQVTTYSDYRAVTH